MGIKRTVRFLRGRQIVRRIAQRPKAVERAKASARKHAVQASINLGIPLEDNRIKGFREWAFNKGMQETFERDLQTAKSLRALLKKRRKAK